MNEEPEENNIVEFTALDYAKYLRRDRIVKLIFSKMAEESIETRWERIVENGDMEEVMAFRNKFHNPKQLKKIASSQKTVLLKYCNH